LIDAGQAIPGINDGFRGPAPDLGAVEGDPALPSITIDDRSVSEGAAITAAFRVFLSAPSPQTVTVSYATANGTATAGSDYTSVSGTLTFTPGRTFHSILVPVLSDAAPEGAETFTVNLSGPVGATLARSQATGTIEPPPAAAIVAMYRAYNFTADYHFFTISQPEAENAVASGYRKEWPPLPFRVASTQVAGSSALIRMYNPNNGRHLYTLSAGERDFLMGQGLICEKDEGFMLPAPQAGVVEVFRMYNRNSGTHLYTQNAAEKDFLLATFPGIWEQHASLGWAWP
jgi:hypothetical protein